MIFTTKSNYTESGSTYGTFEFNRLRDSAWYVDTTIRIACTLGNSTTDIIVNETTDIEEYLKIEIQNLAFTG